MIDWTKVKTLEDFKTVDPLMFQHLREHIVNNHCANGALEYVIFGMPQGHFLTYLFENNLVRAFGQADSSNAAHMQQWAMWLFNSAPSECWGSEEKALDWQSRGGLVGWMLEQQRGMERKAQGLPEEYP